jgi:2-(1,2-epoxy-1,2-dihydrophenyl)acetyl-CoA isomerase
MLRAMPSYQSLKLETVLFEQSGGLATLTLNRPERMNGMTSLMVREAHDVLAAVAGDPSVSVLLLTGAGSSFCPGADLKAATAPSSAPNRAAEGVVSTTPGAPSSAPNRAAEGVVSTTPVAAEATGTADAHHFRVPVLLHQMPAITVAAINGACAGAGFGWACGCDLRVAARSAMFNTAFLNVAVAGDMGLPWSLPRLIGAARARELSFFSEKFSAEEARRIGLVARVWDDEVFRGEVEKMVSRLVNAAPLALKTLKAHYLAAEGGGFGDYVELETADHLRIMRSEDTAEAFRAFLEKRPPLFKGV